ncbi:Hypothetical predicted protein [Mytilus galloprovincialis]|uniref:C1q domain-containing protein n=1 Tax=Mytilus galloprovincialis TaxID=29158 RepID=A0A8B6GFA4_MYTGA|nr:Hypothetical predicted protein [Mytilus galloprovincialis]
MESKQNATNVEVLNALSEIKTLDGKFAQESDKIKTLVGNFAQESVKHKTIESKFAGESVKIKTLEDKFAEKSVNIRTLESKFAQESVKIKTLEGKFAEFGAITKNLKRQVADNRRKVAITACVSSSASYFGSVTFSNVQTQIGIHNSAAFKSNGKFVCEIPSLYYISAYIRTSTKNSAFYLYKNNKQISRSASGSGTYTDVPISAVVELQTNDKLYVQVYHSVFATNSCVTIAKIN